MASVGLLGVVVCKSELQSFCRGEICAIWWVLQLQKRLDKMAATEDAESIAGSLRTLCREKCSEMDLKNHRTSYNALKKIGEPHRTCLQHMGYSVRLLGV